MDVVPSQAGRPSIVTKWVQGVKTTFFVSVRDEVFLREKREWRQLRASAHPDKHGSTFLDTQRGYRKWLEEWEAWYAFLGLKTPDKDVPRPAIPTGVPQALIALIAERRALTGTLLVRAFRLLHPHASDDELRVRSGIHRKYWNVVSLRSRRRQTRPDSRQVQIAGVLLDGAPLTAKAIAEVTGCPLGEVASCVGDLRARGLDIETKFKPVTYQFRGLTDVGHAKLRQLLDQKDDHDQETTACSAAVA